MSPLGLEDILRSADLQPLGGDTTGIDDLPGVCAVLAFAARQAAQRSPGPVKGALRSGYLFELSMIAPRRPHLVRPVFEIRLLGASGHQNGHQNG